VRRGERHRARFEAAAAQEERIFVRTCFDPLAGRFALGVFERIARGRDADRHRLEARADEREELLARAMAHLARAKRVGVRELVGVCHERQEEEQCEEKGDPALEFVGSWRFHDSCSRAAR
jgi:hypothetical protein